MHRSPITFGFLVLVIFISLAVIQPVASEPLEVVAEGRDFATQILRDPWDMMEYSDVSQYLNASNNYVSLDTVSVSDGLFSAREITYLDAGFHVLFPGYTSALMVGKVGNVYKIPSSDFQCLYYAMSFDHLTENSITSAFWFENDSPSSAWGKTPWKTIPDASWRLYKYFPITNESGTTPWGDRNWAGLKILPIYNSPLSSQPTFTIDWVRLTDCDPVYKTITWSGTGSVNIYLEPVGSGRLIEVETGITNKAYPLDVQGIEPGDYTYYVKQGSSTLSSGSFTINAAPIITIEKPSMTSGEDFALTAGNKWDMSDTIDAADTYDCVTESWADGLMSFTTVDKLVQKTGCYSGTIPDDKNNDPIFYLNTPGTIDPSLYRYLTYRIFSDGRPISGSDPVLYYQDIVRGMVIRYGVALGPGGTTCKEVSNDIPFDVGWNTYSIDLHHGDDGKFEERTGSCPSSSYWNNTGAIEIMRLDPNENELGRTLHQELDWIKLTKMDQVQAGSLFTIMLNANKPASAFAALTYYYTTSLSDPTQHTATVYSPAAHSGPFSSFLAQVTNQFVDEYDPQDIRIKWDTTGVSPANYYICVRADDGKNTVLYCSDAPVKVTN